MKKINSTYIDNLVSKIINETLEERADSLVSKIKSNVNELGGMDDDHPTFGKLNLSKMSDKEIEALLNKPVRDEFDDDDDFGFESPFCKSCEGTGCEECDGSGMKRNSVELDEKLY